jgi:acetyl esterase
MAISLWPPSYEAFREEARYAAQNARERAEEQLTRPPDMWKRVREHRSMLSARESAVPSGTTVQICGVPCRVFLPSRVPHGLYVHLHGGGLIAGSALVSDAANHRLCREKNVVVVSVDYRLAPEDPFPAALDDAVAVVGWLIEHAAERFSADALILGGESAGAYLAVSTLLRLRDNGHSINVFRGANLIYGPYDLSQTPSQRGGNVSSTVDILDPETLEFMTGCYLPGLTKEDRRDPLTSPLFAKLTSMPPALFTVGSADHLLDDSVFMANRWAAAGAVAELAVYPDCPHGFLRHDTALAKHAAVRIDAFIDSLLHGSE